MKGKITIPIVFIIYLLREITYLLTFNKAEEVAIHCIKAVSFVVLLHAFYYYIQVTLMTLFVK